MRGRRWGGLLAALLVLLGTAGLSAAESPAEPPVSVPTEGATAQKPVSEEYQLYAENNRFRLFIAPAEGYVLLEDRQGTAWKSVPDGHEEDPLAKGSVKMAMESLLQIQYADRLGNLTELNAKTASVNKGGLTCGRIEDGAKLLFSFEREGFSIPLELVLKEDCLEASLLASEIEETNAAYQLTTVSLLPHFGAADSEAEGYLFVPDGSGALIELNQPGRTAGDYRQYLYGREQATAQPQLDSMEQTAKLPVFGLKSGDSAMLGIVTSGAGRGLVNASVNGKRCSYSNIYASFIYRDSEMVYIEKKGQTVRVLESDPPKPERYTVQYRFLQGEEADYVGMAHVFGDWLFSGSSERMAEGAPMILEIPGGIMAQENVLGFPVNRVVPLAGYADVQSMTEELRRLGVDDLTVNYLYWGKDGTGAAVPDGMDPEGRLGGKKAFRQMLDTLEAEGTALYLDVNLTDMVKSRWGYHTGFDSAASIQKSPAVQYMYYINTLKARKSDPVFLLRSDKFRKAAAGIVSDAKKYSFTGFSAHTLGQKLYSDFGGQERRDTAEKTWQGVLEELRQAKGRQLLSAPNAYAVPYADIITDAPLYSSGFFLESRTVPFYTIALHGRVLLSTPSLNRMSDPEKGLLAALENGLTLKYQMMMGNSERLAETDYNDLTGCLFSDWSEEAAEAYREVQKVLRRVTGKAIVSHQFLTEEVRQTVFEGGVRIIVNYGNEAYDSPDGVVKANGYLVSGL